MQIGQSMNDSGMPFRVLEYLVAVTRVHGRIPKQILLYVGRKPLEMASRFEWADGIARFTLIDMRELNAEPLIASAEPSDNILGILGKLKDRRAAIPAFLGRAKFVSTVRSGVGAGWDSRIRRRNTRRSASLISRHYHGDQLPSVSRRSSCLRFCLALSAADKPPSKYRCTITPCVEASFV